MTQVNDFQWRQLSMWELAPADSINKYQTCGEHTFHYYLQQVTKVIHESGSSKHLTLKTVTSLDEVPSSLLQEPKCQYFISVAHRSTRIGETCR